MEASIKVNLQEATFDVEIRGLSLGCTSNLSTLAQAVAENIKSTFILSGANPKKAEEAVNLLLQGRRDIQGILVGVFRDS